MTAPERAHEADADADAESLDDAHARIESLTTAIAERTTRIETIRRRLAEPSDASTPMARHRERVRELERTLAEARATRDALPQPKSTTSQMAPWLAMLILFLAWLVMVYRP